MATVLVFDIETIPDVAGLRRLEDFPESMSDVEVAAKAMADRTAKNRQRVFAAIPAAHRCDLLCDSQNHQRWFAPN